MLKTKNYIEGTLYSRINKATEDKLITEEMVKWTREIILDANEQGHDDEKINLPVKEDAERSIEFALTLAEYLFVLPSRVNKGLIKNDSH